MSVCAGRYLFAKRKRPDFFAGEIVNRDSTRDGQLQAKSIDPCPESHVFPVLRA
jgi:hypothetical protein